MTGSPPLAAILSTPRRWPLATATVAIVLLATIAILSVAPYVFERAAVGKEIAVQIRTATGLQISTRDEVRFNLLPRPNVVAEGIHVIDPSGAVSIDALQMLGHARFLPLLVGRVELTDAILVNPHLVIDLDGHAATADSTIGRAINGSTDTTPPQSQSLGIVTLVNGSATLKSRKFSNLPKFERLNVTIDWPDLSSPATMTGSADIRNVPMDFTTWLAEPSNLMRGGHTDLTVNLHSTPLDVSLTGELADPEAPSFRGHVVASATSLADVLTLAGSEVALPAPFGNFGLTGDATLALDREGQTILDLPNLQLRADNNAYDGTLAIQTGTAPLISGTLASDQLNLAPFLRSMPALFDDQHRWSQTPIKMPSWRALAFDLRVSASRLRVASLTINDAALSILTREGRTEVGLIEGKAYGGSIRGRLSIGSDDARLNIRGAASIADLDASTFGWDILGRQVATGTLAASLNLDTGGDSPSAWIHGLSGSGSFGVQNGELSTVDLASTSQNPTPAASGPGHTPFQSLSMNTHIGNGIAVVEQGSIRNDKSDWSLSGQIDMVHTVVALTASPTGTSARGAQELSIGGSLGHLLVRPLPKSRP